MIWYMNMRMTTGQLPDRSLLSLGNTSRAPFYTDTRFPSERKYDSVLHFNRATRMICVTSKLTTSSILWCWQLAFRQLSFYLTSPLCTMTCTQRLTDPMQQQNRKQKQLRHAKQLYFTSSLPLTMIQFNNKQCQIMQKHVCHDWSVSSHRSSRTPELESCP